jgi:hypothetical protein
VGGKLENKVDKIRALTELLPGLQDPHLKFVLLRHCLSLPKISFLLQTINTSTYVSTLREFDRITRKALTRILRAPVPDRAWQQARLPVSMCSLGLQTAEEYAPAAFTASFLASRTLAGDLLTLTEGASLSSLPCRS